jgi:Leucine-rich repeat (LRR) protein
VYIYDQNKLLSRDGCFYFSNAVVYDGGDSQSQARRYRARSFVSSFVFSMIVKLALLVTFVSATSNLEPPKEVCKYSHSHRVAKATCSNFDVTPKWEKDLLEGPTLDKLILKNVTGSLDLSNISTLGNLTYLSVSHSTVGNISFGQNSKLEFLVILRNKKFPDLSRDFFTRIVHINWLSIVSNNHTIAANTFRLLKNMTWLHIQNEKLEHLTGEFFKENPKLHEITIRNCHLREIDVDTFDSTTELEILSLNFNRIKYFKIGTFKNLKKLKILELHHNRFVDFNLQQFQGAVSLKILGLPSNFWKNIKTSDELQAVFPKLQKLEVKKKDLVPGDVKIRELRIRGIHIIGTPHDCHYSHVLCSSVM